MFGRSFRIATIRGIPVNVDASWLWIAVLVIFTLWARFDVRFPDLGSGFALLFGVLGAALFFGSVFCHELAHAVTARLSGIRVEGITLVFFGGFTAARSDERGPGPAFAIAALGPGTSLALSGAFWALSRATQGTDGPVPWLLGYVGWVNLFMAVFNVLPGLPLDGGRMVQAAVWRLSGNRDRGTTIAARAGMGVGVLLFGGALLAGVREELFSAVWLVIIGVFIFQGARASEQHIGLARRLAGATVADAMDPPPAAVPADLSLSETLDRHLRGHEDEAFPVIDGGTVIGMISFSSARELGARDPLRPARDALIPLDRVLVAHPDEPLDQVSGRLGTGGAALVLRGGRLVGAITGGGVYRWMASHAR
ncbi:MAG TPA: site-2 protease family protein [Actinomycetota bacterium]|nr:site-2 protease family protein [Actinomycetota bacterium]